MTNVSLETTCHSLLAMLGNLGLGYFCFPQSCGLSSPSLSCQSQTGKFFFSRQQQAICIGWSRFEYALDVFWLQMQVVHLVQGVSSSSWKQGCQSHINCVLSVFHCQVFSLADRCLLLVYSLYLLSRRHLSELYFFLRVTLSNSMAVTEKFPLLATRDLWTIEVQWICGVGFCLGLADPDVSSERW